MPHPGSETPLIINGYNTLTIIFFFWHRSVNINPPITVIQQSVNSVQKWTNRYKYSTLIPDSTLFFLFYAPFNKILACTITQIWKLTRWLCGQQFNMMTKHPPVNIALIWMYSSLYRLQCSEYLF